MGSLVILELAWNLKGLPAVRTLVRTQPWPFRAQYLAVLSHLVVLQQAPTDKTSAALEALEGLWTEMSVSARLWTLLTTVEPFVVQQPGFVLEGLGALGAFHRALAGVNAPVDDELAVELEGFVAVVAAVRRTLSGGGFVCCSAYF